MREWEQDKFDLALRENAPFSITEPAADFAHLGVIHLRDNLGNHLPRTTAAAGEKKGKYSFPYCSPTFPWLTKKPVCQACTQEQNQEVPEPPPLMSSKRGRPAQIDTSRQFCPQQECRYFGWLRRGNITANGHPSGGLWRQYYCKACGHWFLETHGTLFFGRRQAVPMLLLVIAPLVEGMGIRAVGRVFGLDPNTVQSWLVAATEQLSAFAAHFVIDEAGANTVRREFLLRWPFAGYFSRPLAFTRLFGLSSFIWSDSGRSSG